jgi:hypothetical protein
LADGLIGAERVKLMLDELLTDGIADTVKGTILEFDLVTGSWSKWHNEELHNLYSLPNIIKIMKSRRMRWMGHVTYILEMKG